MGLRRLLLIPLLISFLFTRLKIEKNLFSKSGDLKIKCTATIDPIYWKSNEESIQGFQERSYINFWNSGNSPVRLETDIIKIDKILFQLQSPTPAPLHLFLSRCPSQYCLVWLSSSLPELIFHERQFKLFYSVIFDSVFL